jgi:hypothetical protein
MSAPPPPPDEEAPPPLPDGPPPPDTIPGSAAGSGWYYSAQQYGHYPPQAAPQFQVYQTHNQYAYAPQYYQPSEAAYQAIQSAYHTSYNPGSSVAAYAQMPAPQQAQAHSLQYSTFGNASAPSQPCNAQIDQHRAHIPGLPGVSGTQDPPSSVPPASHRTLAAQSGPVSLPRSGGITLQLPTAPLNNSALEKPSCSSHDDEQVAGRKARRQFSDAPPSGTQVSNPVSGADNHLKQFLPSATTFPVASLSEARHRPCIKLVKALTTSLTPCPVSGLAVEYTRPIVMHCLKCSVFF